MTARCLSCRTTASTALLALRSMSPLVVLRGMPWSNSAHRMVQNGKVTDRGLAELRERMPFADLSQFEQNRDVAQIGDLFTVELIARYVQGKLGK